MEDQNRIISKTPFLFVGVLTVPGFSLGAFYYLIISPEEGMALAGILNLIALVIHLIVLFFEQLLVYNLMKYKKPIWIIEILMLVSTVFYFSNYGIG
ncbi:MAG: hypothetical protein JJ958_10780 [Balneola sp.]|nr:hypothetical protein [Balneola sp.]